MMTCNACRQKELKILSLKAQLREARGRAKKKSKWVPYVASRWAQQQREAQEARAMWDRMAAIEAPIRFVGPLPGERDPVIDQDPRGGG